MNMRERFTRTMNFKDVDRVPIWDFGPWAETLNRWYKEGLPQDVHLQEYLGLDRYEDIGIDLMPLPRFEVVTIEETEKYRICVDLEGVTKKETKDHESMAHFIAFPIKNRASWEEFKKRLNPNSPARYPQWWEECKRRWRERDCPLVINAGSLYGRLRNWIGVENLSVMLYDDPGLVHDMMDYMCDFTIQVIHKALDEVDVDWATIFEDMSYKGGSLLSPVSFRKFMTQNYKKIASLLREHGVDVIFVDSDGNIDELTPLWMEAGINGVYPIEIAAGMDPVALRKKYGRNLLLVGGIDKRVLAKNKDAIHGELTSKVPFLCTQGGYIPMLDHMVPPDVSLENYVYYLELLKKIVANPEKYM